MKRFALLFALTLTFQVSAKDLTYLEIAKKHEDVALSKKQVETFKMHGHCLVALKELNFKKKDNFDPVAEWTSYRSISLLEQFTPCEVLIMMEVARKELVEKQK